MRALAALLLCAAALRAAEPPAPVPPVEALKEQAIAYAEAQSASQGGSRRFRVVQEPRLPAAKGDLRFEPTHMSKQEPIGRFFIAFRVLTAGRPTGTVRVDLEGQWAGTVLKVKTALGRKAVPDSEQVEQVPFEGVPPAGTLTEFPEGFRLRLPVAAGHILVRTDLEPIPIVNPGEQVRLTVVSDALSAVVELFGVSA